MPSRRTILLSTPLAVLLTAALSGCGLRGEDGPNPGGDPKTGQETGAEIIGHRVKTPPVAMFSGLQQSTPEALGFLPAHCPKHTGPYPYKSPADDGPVLNLFSDGPLPPGSEQIRISLNDDGKMTAATNEAFSCDQLTEGNQAYRFDFKPTNDVAGYFFVHTEHWQPLNLQNTRALAFDVKTKVDFNVYLESLDAQGDVVHSPLPISNFITLDGEWHSVEILLRNFPGLNPSRVLIPFAVTGVQEAGSVYFDHIRFTDYRHNAPPRITYTEHHILDSGRSEMNIRVSAADLDNDNLVWNVVSRPSNGHIILDGTNAGLEIHYKRLHQGRLDMFEVEVDDGHGHNLVVPFTVTAAEGVQRPIDLYSDQENAHYRPLIVITHWNGGAREVPSSVEQTAGDLMLEGGYGNGALIFATRYGVPLDISQHRRLEFDFRWSAVDDTVPVFKVVFEGDGASLQDGERRHEAIFDAPEDRWSEISIDLKAPFENDTDKRAISKVMIYVWNNAQVKIDNMVII